MTHPATAAEAWAALISEGPTADAVRSYLAPGPEPRYDTPQAQAQAERAGARGMNGRIGYPGVHAGNSSQARLAEATAADAGALRSIRDGFAASGWTERVAEAESWLAVAEQDHAAAVAGIDYRDLAAMGPESVMTESAPCGYPDLEAGQ
jgi:hypothetical protein